MSRNAAFGLLALAGSAAAGGTCSGTSWDFFLLNQQWDITECMDVFSCTASNQFFTIHGLWPQQASGNFPCNCNSQAFNIKFISNITTAMNTYWPSLNGANSDFWSHEWSKHGTCAETQLPTQFDYFNTALTLRSQYDVVAALASAGIKPSNTVGFTMLQFKTATQKAYGAPALVQCDTDGNIEQVEVCVSKDGSTAVVCQGTYDQCGASKLFLPASMSAEKAAALKAKRAAAAAARDAAMRGEDLSAEEEALIARPAAKLRAAGKRNAVKA